ncbi:MAG TPA: type II toxin-antitoxin system RelE/ParE family toxin [Opitutaceae bacterium]|nr:type II toxin-antitoxin system RelE/ParE family toxin [Opitutaceae bacterium]
MSGEDRAMVIEEIARNPEVGDIVQGTGGVRKVRIALPGRGKSGGARVVFYYQNDQWPVLLLEVFAKNEKANLSKAQRNAVAKLIAELKAARKKK